VTLATCITKKEFEMKDLNNPALSTDFGALPTELLNLVLDNLKAKRHVIDKLCEGGKWEGGSEVVDGAVIVAISLYPQSPFKWTPAPEVDIRAEYRRGASGAYVFVGVSAKVLRKQVKIGVLKSKV
jgi:hypothetical protein